MCKIYIYLSDIYIFVYFGVFKYGSFIYYDNEMPFTLVVTQCFAEPLWLIKYNNTTKLL